MDLILFTSSKKRDECAKAEEVVKEVARRFGKDLHTSMLDLEERANRMTALQFRISTPPALVFDGEPIFTDRFPTADELAKFIEEKIKEYSRARRAGRSRYWSISGLPESWSIER
jgi:hypothetical protein